jgi:hypothetical protein
VVAAIGGIVTGRVVTAVMRIRHRKAIDKLVEIIPTPLFENPVSEHPEHINRLRELSESSPVEPDLT